jgi:uncharacterized membrane protein YfcA
MDMDSLPVLGVLSLVSCTVAGITAFGDAIMFHLLRATLSAAGYGGAERADLQRAVLYVLCFSLAKQPLQVYVSRGALARCAPYSLAQFVTGSVFNAVGVSLLFFGNLRAVKICVGIFFLGFSLSRLAPDCVKVARRRVHGPAAAGGPLMRGGSTPEAPASGEAGAKGAVNADEWWVDSKEDEPPSVAPPPTVCGVAVRPISPIYSAKATLCAYLCTGVVSGVMGGLMGVAGPPQMAIAMVLRLDKDDIRGVGVAFACLTLPVQALLLTTTAGTVFDLEAAWPKYAVVMVGAVCGTSIGIWIRRFVDTEDVVRVLLVLIALSSFTLFVG